MTIRVEEYLRADGSSLFGRWFGRLDPVAAARVVIALERVRSGNTSNVKWFAGIGECVINWGPGYRVYLARHGPALIVLYGGGTKHRQRGDITRARELHAEYKARARD